MAGVEQNRDRYARTFDVLELLAGHPEGLTVTEIATRLELPVSSSHNLLGRMAASEVVSVSDGPRYSLGPRAVRLGIRIADGLEVRALARRHLQELARTTGEDVYLAVRLGRRITYVERVAGSRPVTVEIRLGQDLYLHATAVGKLFAAADDGLRRRLWSRERPRPNQGRHTGMPPRTGTEPSRRAEGDVHRTGDSPLGAHSSTWAPKGSTWALPPGPSRRMRSSRIVMGQG